MSIAPAVLRSSVILDAIREEFERVGLEDPDLRSVVVTIKLNAATGGIRTVLVTRETERQR